MSTTDPTQRRPQRRPLRRPRRGARGALPAAVLASVLLLSGCGGDGHQAPRGWIGEHYRYQSHDVYLDPADPPVTVADEIEGNTPAKDRIVDGDLVLLRYDDDIVAVQADGTRGSRIDIDDYNSGMTRYSSRVGNRWPQSQHRSGGDFRGGGPGSGK
ncbi:DUF4247 domain-containing protein [Streptomyces hoynatensis]|uniref:DUF4247 domain-containing protein n=1 Tax=Streptomyces hoynatensis TaxID=1141874 RepID=UPI00131A36B1|nr:DUF4247 domain-containing protein [Streptomyces hoynatensis]